MIYHVLHNQVGINKQPERRTMGLGGCLIVSEGVPHHKGIRVGVRAGLRVWSQFEKFAIQHYAFVSYNFLCSPHLILCDSYIPILATGNTTNDTTSK